MYSQSLTRLMFSANSINFLVKPIICPEVSTVLTVGREPSHCIKLDDASIQSEQVVRIQWWAFDLANAARAAPRCVAFSASIHADRRRSRALEPPFIPPRRQRVVAVYNDHIKLLQILTPAHTYPLYNRLIHSLPAVPHHHEDLINGTFIFICQILHISISAATQLLSAKWYRVWMTSQVQKDHTRQLKITHTYTYVTLTP